MFEEEHMWMINMVTSIHRQWHQKFTTALGQVGAEQEEIVHRLVREIDLGRDMGNILVTTGREYGAAFGEASRYL